MVVGKTKSVDETKIHKIAVQCKFFNSSRNSFSNLINKSEIDKELSGNLESNPCFHRDV